MNDGTYDYEKVLHSLLCLELVTGHLTQHCACVDEIVYLFPEAHAILTSDYEVDDDLELQQLHTQCRTK